MGSSLNFRDTAFDEVHQRIAIRSAPSFHEIEIPLGVRSRQFGQQPWLMRCALMMIGCWRPAEHLRQPRHRTTRSRSGCATPARATEGNWSTSPTSSRPALRAGPQQVAHQRHIYHRVSSTTSKSQFNGRRSLRANVPRRVGPRASDESSWPQPVVSASRFAARPSGRTTGSASSWRAG